MVERLSWFGKRHQAQTVMHFAQVKGLPPRLIADTASGAVYAAFEWDEYGNTERRYLDTLRSRLGRPAGRALQTYGLKICPWPHPRHSWVQAFCRR